MLRPESVKVPAPTFIILKPPLITPETVKFEVRLTKPKEVLTVRISGQEMVAVNPAFVVIEAPALYVSVPTVLEITDDPEKVIVPHAPFAESVGAKITVPPTAGMVTALAAVGTPEGVQFDGVFQSFVMPLQVFACAFVTAEATVQNIVIRIKDNFN